MRRRTELLCAVGLLALGFAARLAWLGVLPAGLNQDEASAGYDAWALLRYGIDRCGNARPVLLESWGSGQNVLYSIFCMPLIALFGLNVLSVRLPQAIFSCAGLILCWRLARRAGGPGFGLAALLFLAVNPWHIMAGRWALESNLLPFFLLLGVDCIGLARDRPWALLGAAAAFGLSLYAYGTAFFFLALFLPAASFWLRGRVRPVTFGASLAVFALMALPITICQLRNLFGMGEMTLFGLTLPALTLAREAETSILGGGGAAAVLKNFQETLRLLVTQSDGLVFNSLGAGGMFYWFGLPLAAVGVVTALRRGRGSTHRPMLLALLAAFLAAIAIDGNINRLNMLWLPVIYFSALGFYTGLKWLRAGRRGISAAVVCILVSFVLFGVQYAEQMQTNAAAQFDPGLGEAIEWAESRSPEEIFITDSVNEPYIFALFYSQTTPQDFLDTVIYSDSTAAFRQVEAFGNFAFGSAGEAAGACQILRLDEVGERRVLAAFGGFAVCTEKPEA